MNKEADSADDSILSSRNSPGFQGNVTDRLAEVPWWALTILLVGVLFVFNLATDETYNSIIRTISVGIRLTIVITISAYFFALIIGLTTALMRLSSSVIFRNVAQLYVQVTRGIPILVQILYWVVIVFPMIADFLRNLGTWMVLWGVLAEDNFLIDISISNLFRGIFALAFSYGAFSSEIFRAGIQSIEKGQIEAGKALGLRWYQSFRFIIFPQAIRRVLPPMGNDFIAMLKESSLLSAVGISEVTQLSRKYAAASFLFLQTYNVTAFVYLTMTLLLSMGVKAMEERLRSEQKNE
jgi:polar amino acid transport system permease protein